MQAVSYTHLDVYKRQYTSNLSLDDLRYDDRITNRIKERTFQLPFPEESVRELIAEKNRKALIEGMRGR